MLVLRRLAEVGAAVTDIRVDSVITRRLPAGQQRVVLRRHRLPLALAQVSDFADLKRDISTAAREPGARQGASRGGSSRRLRFTLEADGWSAHELEHHVAGAGAIPEVDAVRHAVNLAAGRADARSQGFLMSPAIKRAVELHAMELAIAHYSRNWQVSDVHADHPYDLECRRGDRVIYVEVKGSTSRGEAVIVTPNEVRHARRIIRIRSSSSSQGSSSKPQPRKYLAPVEALRAGTRAGGPTSPDCGPWVSSTAPITGPVRRDPPPRSVSPRSPLLRGPALRGRSSAVLLVKSALNAPLSRWLARPRRHKTLFQALTTAAVANLTLIAGKVGLLPSADWAAPKRKVRNRAASDRS
jgi:hypothetical protein